MNKYTHRFIELDYGMFKDIKRMSPKEVKLLMCSIFEYAINNKIPNIDNMSVRSTFDLFKENRDAYMSILLHSGENHWNWKGGITTENHADRNSTKYKKWRLSVFKRDNYTCVECGDYGCRLEAHHIKLFSTHKHLRFDIDNGQTLCKPCHKDKHTRKANN